MMIKPENGCGTSCLSSAVWESVWKKISIVCLLMSNVFVAKLSGSFMRLKPLVVHHVVLPPGMKCAVQFWLLANHEAGFHFREGITSCDQPLDMT